MERLRLTWRRLSFPVRFDVEQVLVFTRALAMRPLHGLWRQPEPVVIETISTPRELRWQVGMTTREAGLLLPLLRTQLANLVLEPASRVLPALDWAIELRLAPHTRPLRTDVPEAVAAALLTALRAVQGDEALVMSWVVGPWLPRPAVQHGDQPGLSGLGPSLTSEEATALRHKFAEPLFGAVGRIGVYAQTPGRQARLVQRVIGALELARAAGVAFTVRRHISGPKAAERLAAHTGPLWNWPCALNAEELATVIGWPIGCPYIPGVTYSAHRQLPAPSGLWVPEATIKKASPGRYRLLGRTSYPGRAGYVHLPAADALHHLHTIGPTGSGKSVLMGHLAEADIRAGRAVVVVEPRSDLIAYLLDRIPPKRVDDVVLIDPTDSTTAVGLDVLDGSTPELAADRIVHVIHHLWRDSWGPRTARLLRNSALALARAGQTLADLPHFLLDAGYRERVLRQAPDPLGIGPYWARFNSLSDNARNEIIGPTLTRLDPFVGHPVIRAMVGQAKPRFAFSDVFTSKRRPVVLVNLAKGVIGPEPTRILGSLILSQLWQAALARSAVPPARRHPVMLYVDEFQDYVSGIALDFGDALSQARGLGVALTVAHQALSQLDATTRAGVLANARSRLVFQTKGPDPDVRALASSLGGAVTPDDLAALGPFEAYASLVHGHAVQPPTSIVTLDIGPSRGAAKTVRRRSRTQWARRIADVEADILARRQPAPASTAGAVGHRRRGKRT